MIQRRTMVNLKNKVTGRARNHIKKEVMKRNLQTPLLTSTHTSKKTKNIKNQKGEAI